MDMFSYMLGAKRGGGSGGGADWNASEGEAGYVKNRTHYEEVTEVGGDTLTWDGNTEGLETADVILFGESAKLSRVSKIFVPISDITEITNLTLQTPEGDMDIISMSMAELTVGQHGYTVGMADMGGEYVIGSDGAYICSNGNALPEGVWVIYANVYGAEQFVKQLTIPGYTGFKTVTTTVKPLDEKYMPTLTSPSGKKFKITVDDSGTVSAVEVTG